MLQTFFNPMSYSSGPWHAPVFISVMLVLAIWEIAWKGVALWRAAQRKQTGWFVAMLILNTAGILPIIYVLITSKKTPTTPPDNTPPPVNQPK